MTALFMLYLYRFLCLIANHVSNLITFYKNTVYACIVYASERMYSIPYKNVVVNLISSCILNCKNVTT